MPCPMILPERSHAPSRHGRLRPGPCRSLFAMLLLAFALGCITPVPVVMAAQAEDSSAIAGTGIAQIAPAKGGIDDELDDYDTTDAYLVPDPLEGWNRMWFGFNDFVLLRIGKPVYRGYEAVTPHELRSGVRNFFHNLLFPVRFVNNLLQGKFSAAGVEMGRFIVNTTVGMGGLIDVAKKDKPVVETDNEDLGQTLGVWGFGEGFYIVWPFFGPSTLRDSVGFTGDYFLDPTWFAITFEESLAANSYKQLNDLGPTVDAYEGLKSGSVEPYSAVRNAYIQLRRDKVER